MALLTSGNVQILVGGATSGFRNTWLFSLNLFFYRSTGGI